MPVMCELLSVLKRLDFQYLNSLKIELTVKEQYTMC